MPSPSDMTAKVALITGAASGLGRATAITLARAGASLCLVDVNAEGLKQTATLLRETLPHGTKPALLLHTTNLGTADNCRNAVNATIAAYGKLDALCNVAAVFIPCHTTAMNDEELQATFAINLAAPFLLIQAAIPHLLKTHGAVVNVTSCAAFVGHAYAAAYSASKAGLTQMTKALAMEYMHQPIRFNAVAPGGMMTAMANTLSTLENTDPSLVSRYSPLRGVVAIEDVAEMVAFLASDAARGYHGACINLDNGISAG